MKLMKKYQRTALTLFVLRLFGIVGCTHSPTVQDFPTTANSADEIERLRSDVSKANDSQQISLLAPRSNEKTLLALARAEEGQKRGKDPEKSLHHVAEGRSYLNRALTVAALSQNNLSGAIEARQTAVAASALHYFAKEFALVDDQLREATALIEDNKVEKGIQGRLDLQKQYLDLELKAIVHKNLGPSREIIATAVAEGAREVAPQSLEDVKKRMNSTESFIFGHRHDAKNIKIRSDDVQRNADHLLMITREAKNNKVLTPEQIALRLEAERKRANENQLHLTEVETEASSLKSDLALAALFDNAKAQYDSSESSVYKQGNSLLIRLHGVQFNVGKSVLRGDNFPLLSKVRQTILDFGPCRVVVEGHTDSDGGKVLNDALSQKRAQAIKDYLVSTSVIASSKITAKGYGYEKPVASNKSRRGKAQNRRVDIIITPEQSQDASARSH